MFYNIQILPVVRVVRTKLTQNIERSSAPDCGGWGQTNLKNTNLFTDGFFSLGTEGGLEKLLQTLKNIFKVQRWESASLQGPPEGGAEAAGGGEAEGGGGEGGAVPGDVGGAGQVRGVADSGGEHQHHPARPGQPGQGPVLPAG